MMEAFLETTQMTFSSNEWLELLLNVSLKGAVLLMAAGLLSYGLRRASSAARHLVWNLALCGLLVLPVLSFVLPEWRAPLLPASSAESVISETIPAIVSEEVRQERSSLPGGKARPSGLPPISEFDEVANAQDERLRDGPLRSERAGSQENPPSIFARTSWPVWSLILWLAGALVVMVRLFVGTVHVWRLARRASEIEDGDWPQRMKNIGRQIHLTRRVRLLESEQVTMPLTWGLFRPVILLPAVAEEWPESRRSVVLLHELAHVKRRDCLTQMLAQIACAVYWFNPLVWLAARRLRTERERACDDYVLGAGTKASDYAGHLLEIARSFREAKCSSLATVAIARRSQLEGRLLAILDPKLSRRRLNSSGVILSGVLVTSFLLPLAALHPVARAQGLSDSAAVESSTQESLDRIFESDPAPMPTPTPASPPEEGEANAQPEKAEQEVLDQITDTAQPTAEQDAGAQERKDNSRVVEVLREALKDEDPDVRRSALFALGQVGDSSVVEAMIEALKSNDSQVRAQAAWALGMKGDSRTVDALSDALKDESAQVRAQAAWALGMKGDSRAVDALSDALKDESAQVRAQAAWALGMKGDLRAADVLNTAMKDQNASVRRQAAWALGMVLIRNR